jgi:hypothetical protein
MARRSSIARQASATCSSGSMNSYRQTLQRQQRRESRVDFIQHALRRISGDLHVTRAPVNAAYFVNQNDSRNRQARRKLHFRWPAALRARDRTHHGFVCHLVIASRGEHDGGTPSCLLVAGTW